MKQALMIPTKVEIELGPAMSSLPDRIRVFAVAFMDNGGNGTEAARAAGYSDKSGGCRVRACNLLKDPRVIAALKELGDARFVEMAPKAIKRVDSLLDMAGHKDHFNAAKYVLGQAGFREARDVNVNTTLTADEDVKAIMRMAAATGQDPRVLLGANAIDVEFEDVDEPLVVDGEEY